MQITFANRVRSDLKKKIRAATEFYAGLLMGPTVAKQLNIEFKLASNYQSQGTCLCDDEDEKKPRFFTILLKRQEEDDMISTLAHEMVHVKQYAMGELRGAEFANGAGIHRDDDTLWHGQVWRPKRREDPYYDSPWEIEAFGREVGLFDRFNKQWERRNGRKRSNGEDSA